MATTLPITIDIAEQLQQRETKLSSVANKLEALFNFRTMTAGWFGDEDNILTIELSVESMDGLAERKTSAEQMQTMTFYQISDDAFALFESSALYITCVIAITENELALIATTPKLLQPLLDKKMVKVLNVIAEQQQLFPID